MKIRLYNTLYRTKQEFKPLKDRMVKFYQCGPTVYWTQHIGNLRAMVMADIINRTFRYLNYKVKFVRNYTDVGHLVSDADEGEDKMEIASRRENLSPLEIANKYIKIFEADTADLNILEPNVKPRATENIDEILKMIKILLDKGFAYKTDLAIYFDVKKFKNYNKLSHQKLEKQKEGAGSGDFYDKDKKNPQDFALWFFKRGRYKNALQVWDSLWGVGFPGWHIECSAMIRKFLGKTIDIHMGGVEHISIHHTNEIAQSEAVNNVPLAKYWLHNEHLLVNGKKMAKSQGNSYSLAELKERGFSPLTLRFFFLMAHYRSKQNFTWQALKAADKGLKKIYDFLERIKINDVKDNKTKKIDVKYKEKFISALSDDFNTPQALVVVRDLLKSNLSDGVKIKTILDFDKVLGLRIKENIYKKEEVPQKIIELANTRLKLRKEGKWDEADRLRQVIKNMGYEIEDTKDGFNLKRGDFI